MSTQSPSNEAPNGTITLVVAGQKYRDQYAAMKHPEWATWMRDDCPYVKTGTPLIPYELVIPFRDWAQTRGYEVRLRADLRARVKA